MVTQGRRPKPRVLPPAAVLLVLATTDSTAACSTPAYTTGQTPYSCAHPSLTWVCSWTGLQERPAIQQPPQHQTLYTILNDMNSVTA
jgi:hypothetical protein